MSEKIKPILIGVASGGVKKNGKPTWFTARRVKAAVKMGKALESLGVQFHYAFVPTKPDNNAHQVLRRLFQELHPEYDGVPISTPEGYAASRRDGRRFIARIGRRRGLNPMVV